MQHVQEFKLEGPPRRIIDAGVSFLDEALAKAAGQSPGSVMHAIDPRRILSFAHGGPPVWSVGTCPCGDGSHLFVTYGLSRFIDADAPFDHEMSIRVHSPEGPPQWPTFLLRVLARYQITSGRELAIGDPMSFGESITRTAMAPQHKAAMPDSAMRAIGVVADPVLQSVRRVYGLRDDEQSLGELWSTAGMMTAIAAQDPALVTHLERPSWASHPAVTAAVHAGGEAEGSQVAAIALPGLRWERRDATSAIVQYPGGSHAGRMAALMRGRLRFARHLVVHDLDPLPNSTVVFLPSEAPFARIKGDVLEIGLQLDSPILTGIDIAARETSADPVTMVLHGVD